MIEIRNNFSLKKYNTFGLSTKAKQIVVINKIDDTNSAIKTFKNKEIFVLGGGSNVLFTKNINEKVIFLNKILGIKNIISKKDFFVQVGGGVVWHNFVKYCVNNNLNGIENLALIPGSVGASPVQNIGAYGVELENVFEKLNAIELSTGKKYIFNKKDCDFGYRKSVFKQKYKNQFIITDVIFKFKKNSKLKTSYGAIEEELEKMKIKQSATSVFNAVINIRKRKLPNPNILGNAGSFFKNPIIKNEEGREILKKYPNMPHYLVYKNHMKIPAGWLIEKTGWKGKTVKNCGVYEKQAIVLVNYGKATGKEIFNLSKNIIKDVNNKFNILLEREVNII